MKALSFIFLSLLLSFAAFAQNEYVSGFILRSGSDTLFGEINLNTIDKNPRVIYFKKNAADAVTTYGPSEITGFKTAGRMFRSAVVNRNVEPLKPLSETTDFILRTDTVFLEMLMAGEKSLAAHEGEDGVQNFFVAEGSSFELLKFKKFLRTADDGRTFVSELALYKPQLAGYLADCADITSKIEKVRYTARDLQKLIRSYYKCKNSSAQFEKRIEKNKVEFGMMAGANITALHFDGDAPVANVDFPSSTGATGGVYLNIIFPRNLRKFSIVNELQYTSFSTQGDEEHDDPNFSAYRYYGHHELAASYIRLNNLLRFSIPVSRYASVYLNAGMSNGLVVSKKNEVLAQTIRYNVVEKTEKLPSVYPFSNYERAFVAGIGAKFGRLHFEPRIEKSNGFLNVYGLKSRVSRYMLMAGWKF